MKSESKGKDSRKEDESKGNGKRSHTEKLVKATTLGLETKSSLRPNPRYKLAYIVTVEC